ncbi:hypothetical protein [Polyangium aurulentum]|uniref:hypothetical protein n=1 Tax=Polyangium aurulentum TaxID=2567896 RepID=UPI0010ADE8F6|nr:hypothetical protein [Polyangium aurulentum]UQA57279.1 hypothetical protein E8A73_039275 [Polyangium aurulentum]
MKTARLSLCLLALAASSAACGNKGTPAPEKEQPKSAPSAAPSPSASSASPLLTAPKERPTLATERFTPTRGQPSEMFEIEGALVVVQGLRVGRIVDDGVEWLDKTVPDLGTVVGGSRVYSVQGRWPDAVDVLYTSNNGRAPMPSYHPLTGKGTGFTFAPGGGLGSIAGLARVGESLLLAGYSSENGEQFMPVRGPAIVRARQSAAEFGCKEGEVYKDAYRPPPPAISPDSFGATRAGTVMSYGSLCSKRGPAMEIWDKATGKSRIVDLGGFAKNMGYGVKFLRAPGEDEAWVFSKDASLVLHYVNDKFEALPKLERPLIDAFASQAGELYVTDGWSIQRFAGGQWTLVAHMPWTFKHSTLAIDDKGQFWMSSAWSVYKLKEGPKVMYHEGCATPFVFLYDVSSDNAKDFTFPSTRKALATFPGAADLSLVEFYEVGRRLGIEVQSKEQGEAVIAHVKANMKGENPVLLCYAPKEERRKIDLKAK